MSVVIDSLVDDVHFEISKIYLTGAVEWCNLKLNQAWSKAVERFNNAVESQNIELIQLEAEIYKTKIAELLNKYKTAKKIKTDADHFFDDLSVLLESKKKEKPTCKHCKKEFETDETLALNKVAAMKGYCNWNCWEKTEPVSSEEIDQAISKTLQDLNNDMIDFPCWCGVCETKHIKKFTQGEIRLLAPLGLKTDGCIAIACDNCA